jgi:hypothetical protein
MSKRIKAEASGLLPPAKRGKMKIARPEPTSLGRNTRGPVHRRAHHCRCAENKGRRLETPTARSDLSERAYLLPPACRVIAPWPQPHWVSMAPSKG